MIDRRHDWLTELPLTAGPPDLRMGVHPLDVARWLPVDQCTASELELRRQLFVEHHDFVHMESGYDTGLEELLSLVEIHIGDRLVTDGAPIERLALSVPDDILLMHRDGEGESGEWRLVGGALLFPNHWRLQDKIGQPITAIHSPVEAYDELLAVRVRKFFDRLSPARPVWRRNWFINDNPTFFAPDRSGQLGITDPDQVEGLWVRSEWQTLRKLAFSQMTVFTVKTQVAPMSAVRDRPELAEQLAVFLAQASPRSLDNKHVLGSHEAVIEYLRRSN